jgi:hypothetical protein
VEGHYFEFEKLSIPEAIGLAFEDLDLVVDPFNWS